MDLDDRVDLDERARRTAGFPPLAAAGAELFADHDRQFEECLATIVAGIETTVSGTRK